MHQLTNQLQSRFREELVASKLMPRRVAKSIEDACVMHHRPRPESLSQPPTATASRTFPFPHAHSAHFVKALCVPRRVHPLLRGVHGKHRDGANTARERRRHHSTCGCCPPLLHQMDAEPPVYSPASTALTGHARQHGVARGSHCRAQVRERASSRCTNAIEPAPARTGCARVFPTCGSSAGTSP